MHICFITHEYPKKGFPHGGIGSFVKTFASLLVKNGVKVSVVGVNYIAEEEYACENGVHIYRVAKSTKKGLAWWFNFNAINAKIQEIHSKTPIHIVEASELGLAFIKKIKVIKYIIRLHGGHHFFAEAEKRKINLWKGFQEKRSFKKADGFIAVSNYAKNHTGELLSFHNKPITVIYGFVDLERFKPSSNPISEFNIVFLGTICEKKGVRYLIKAFPLVKEKFPDAVLNLYGRDWFYPDGGSYIESVKEGEKQIMDKYGKDIVFHGMVDNVSEVLEKAQVCVFPSLMETQGLVALEAMAMGKNVIFTELGPGKEIIDNYKTGLVCNPYSPQDIADKITWVFSSNESKKMGESAYRYMQNEYNPDKILEKNSEFYNQILKDN